MFQDGKILSLTSAWMLLEPAGYLVVVLWTLGLGTLYQATLPSQQGALVEIR